VLPIIGFFLAVAPAWLLKLSVSPSTAIFVLMPYLAYHLFEACVLVPKVDGKSLRLSTLIVLVSGNLTGIAGGLSVLPIVVSYAVIERVG